MRNLHEMLIFMMGIAATGGIIVFLNAWWTSREPVYALDDSCAKIIFADGTRAERFKHSQRDKGLTLIGVSDGEETLNLACLELLREKDKKGWPENGLQGNYDFAIVYSSDNTGYPKAVLLTHRGVISAVFSWLVQAPIAELLEPTEDRTAETRSCLVILIATPLFHVTTNHPNFLCSLASGAKLCPLAK